MKNDDKMTKIVNLCKRRGFIFPSSEIYGGTRSAWDYGPLGILLKNNVKAAWWRDMVQLRDDMVGQDAAIIMNSKVWEASGHVGSFHDPLVECKKCHKRFREDHLREGKYGEVKSEDGMAMCPLCGGMLTENKKFNLMFRTFLGPVEDSSSIAYLRPETAQGIFVNFKSILETTRQKLPFGIAQIGKAFRNEITPGNFIFRTREFEQMEVEYFVKPEDAKKAHKEWLNDRLSWYGKYGIKKEALRLRKHDKDEMAHYAEDCSDVEYKFPFGWSELEGIANRCDYDLRQHEKFSGKDMKYFDPSTGSGQVNQGKKYYPYVIEPSAGADRAALAFLVDAYEEVGKDDKTGRKEGEVVLHLHPKLAPYKVAILPLVKKDKKLLKIAKDLYDELKQVWFVYYDEVASIGRRYRRQDEIGTPWCVTVDFDSLKDKAVTVRDRDSMKQKRIKIEKLKDYFIKQLQ